MSVLSALNVLKGKLPADVVIYVVPSDLGEAAKWVYHFLSGVGKGMPVMWAFDAEDVERIAGIAHSLRDYIPKTIAVVVPEDKVNEAYEKFRANEVSIVEVSKRLMEL